MILKIIIGIIGSIALFLYGMKIMSKGLESLAGPKLREIIKKITSNRFSELATGFMLGGVMQSSGSAMAMVIGFVNANFLALSQCVAIILGAGLGATIVVQLIAFRLTKYALLFIGVGFFVSYVSKQKIYANIGNIAIGFGFILLALQFFGDLVVPMQTGLDFKNLLLTISKEPILAIIISALLTAVFNSSSVMLGILIAITAGTPHMTLATAMPIMLGANLGTCITSIIASVGTSPEAKRVALLHVTFKVIGIILFLPLLPYFTNFLGNNNFDVSRQIANAHTFFNAVLVVIFLPFVRYFADFAAKMIPSVSSSEEIGFQIKYLDYRIIENPILALGHVQKETRRLADRVQDMFDSLLNLLTKNNIDMADKIEKKEVEADTLSRSIMLYLSELGQHPLTPDESKKASSLLYIANDLEHIGDVISRLTKLGRKKVDNALLFSKEGIEELIEMHKIVRSNFDMAVIASLTGDAKLANKVIETNEKLIRMERDLRQTHIGRLWAGQKFTLETSSIHLDMINGFQRINEHAVNIAHAVIGEL